MLVSLAGGGENYNAGMYSAQLLEHFQNPRHSGRVDDADATAEMENPACGDILELTAKVADGCLTAVRFRAKGCVPSMACGSALTELVQGMSLEAAYRLRREDIVEKIGGLPEASTHASYLAMDALAALLKGLSQISETSK
jgi:nitrogen fixation NifU-like protein